MTQPLLLLIESNTTGTGRQFAQRARALGIEPVLVSADPSRYPYATEDGIRVVVVDTSDESAVLSAARRSQKEARVAGVTSSSEYYVATAAATARVLDLPGPDAQAVRMCRNKARQRDVLRGSGVPVPEYELVRTADEAWAAAKRIGHPVVIKPVQGSGSLGVRLCEGPDETMAHAAALTALAVNERGVPVPRDILVEEYVRGAEYSVEVFGLTAVVVVTKHLGPLPHFVELGHDLPAALPTADTARVAEHAVRAVQALGLGWGAAHVELRMQGTDVRVIEVNPRLAGGLIPELIKQALGIDLVGSQVRAAVGMDPVHEPAQTTKTAAIRFLTTDRPGSLADQARTEEAVAAAHAIEHVTAAMLYRGPGERIAPARDFRDRLGHAIATADDSATAGRAAAQALEALTGAFGPTTVETPV
ncbi:ATP-grasp domain-containing protein [Streptomyces griseoviridis]|uniref:ATP-grasp domain-containing protein n=1 Tax=Streptomyces TaxID=1883 RepID=UPI002476ED11|nr:ATP-grasp domain-containing protein [Streptomyces sp. MAA16]MDH6703287.1 biotin carboxylase [Streptomyces sp. MAA16]